MVRRMPRSAEMEIGRRLGQGVAVEDDLSLAAIAGPATGEDLMQIYREAQRNDPAIAAAKAAFPAWSRSTPQERYDALNKVSVEILSRKEELGRLLAREEGKTLPEGIGEAGRAGYIFKFFAGEALRIPGEIMASVRPGIGVEVTREPVGVVAMITPHENA